MISTKLIDRRGTQVLAWSVASLFILGFFFPLIGVWTGVILGVWFVGTQKPLARIRLDVRLRLRSPPVRKLA